jgi:hypothetical protein
MRVIKEEEMGAACGMHGMRNAYKILVREPEWRRPLGRPGHRLWDNIRMDLRKTEWEVVWTECIWLRIGTSRQVLVNTVLNLCV